MSATLPTTVISPSVSKPRKSTRMTFTTLRPPAGSSAFAKKNGASTDVPGRVITANASTARPLPAAAASVASRARRRVRARRAPARIVELEPPRQPAQAEQEQHHRHDLDRDLREREIGRGEPREREARDEPRAADHDQRREPMELRLPRRADRARALRRPRARANSGSTGVIASAPPEPAARPQRPGTPPRSALSDDQHELRLQPAARTNQRATRARARA